MFDDIKEFLMIALLMAFSGIMFAVGVAAIVLLMAAPFLAIGLGIAGAIELVGWAIG